MRAALLTDSQLGVGERPTPVPGHGDVRIAVWATSINAADLLQREGLYPAPPGWPSDIPGLECAGVVEAIGDGVDAAWLGKRVCTIVGGGGHATHALAPARHLLPIPDDVSWEQAGGFAEVFCTAFDALVRQAHLQPGERVLISGASGGVGTAALQIARLIGAHVIAVVRDHTHDEALVALGADEVVPLNDVTRLMPVDVVLELVGAAHLSRAQEVLAPRARIVVIGVGGGRHLDLDLVRILTTRATLTGATLRARSVDEKAELIDELTPFLADSWRSGILRVPVAATFSLGAIAEAYDYFSQPGKLGKIVVTVEP